MSFYRIRYQVGRRLAVLAALLIIGFSFGWGSDAFLTGSTAKAETGLPIPRFVSLRAGEVNLRTGPGVRYPVEWVYRRRWMPVQIIAEFDTWRKIRDWEGTEGWVHQSMLSGRRSALIIGERQNLYRRPDTTAPVVARAEAGVIGRLEECDDLWCRGEVAGIEGWLLKSSFWGAFEDERFD